MFFAINDFLLRIRYLIEGISLSKCKGKIKKGIKTKTAKLSLPYELVFFRSSNNFSNSVPTI